MGRGQSKDASAPHRALIPVRRAAPAEAGGEFPAPELDPRHPISDLWQVRGRLGSAAAEQRVLAECLAAPILRIDGSAGDVAPRHSGMISYRDRGRAVLALAIDRRFEVWREGDVERGSVGDFLVQDDDGSARVSRRREFLSRYRPLPLAGPGPSLLQVPLSEARQALVDGDLERAFSTLRGLGAAVALERNIELRELSEVLLEASWQRAQEGISARVLAERVTDWVGAA